MKTLMTAAVDLTIAAPAFAQVDNAEAYFALSNDSGAERILPETSAGNAYDGQKRGA